MTPSQRAAEYLKQQIAASGLSKKDWYWQVYLKSDHWQQLRQAKLDFSGRFCHCCQSKENLDIHHLEYRNIYDVTMFDLEVLCRRCHNAEHGKVETFRDYDSRNNPSPSALQTMAQIKAFYKSAKVAAKGHWTKRVQEAHDKTLQALKKRGKITARESRWLACVLQSVHSQKGPVAKAKRKTRKRKKNQ